MKMEKLIIPFRYDYISNFNDNVGLAARGGKWTIIDTKEENSQKKRTMPSYHFLKVWHRFVQETDWGSLMKKAMK